MKRFFCSLAGKMTVFLLLALSVCVLAASVVGIAFFLSDEFSVYTSTEEKLAEDRVLRDPLYFRGYSVLRDVISGIAPGMEDAEWRILDAEGTEVAQSEHFSGEAPYGSTFTFWVLTDPDGTKWTDFQPDTPEGYEKYSVHIAPAADSGLKNEIELELTILHIAFLLRYWIYLIAFGALLLSVGLFAALMYLSGRRGRDGETHPGPLYRVPFDLLLAFCVCGMALLFYMAGYLFSEPLMFSAMLALTLVSLNVFFGLCMSAAVRIRCRTFLYNTVIRMLLHGLRRLFRGAFRLLGRVIRAVPTFWRTLLIFGAAVFGEVLLWAAGDFGTETVVLLWAAEKILLLPALLYFAWSLRRLQKSGDALAKGDLSYHTDTRGLPWDLKKHGENLNRIAEGMSAAVEQRTRSERMKTELITNVSHDLKTPLTSVANYAGLIAAEPSENPKIAEYAEVLVRQSGKLKRLIEDLTEASKAATGNLDVTLAPCDASVLLSQVSGEYAGKLQAAGLTPVFRQPETELTILADGRRMWRIFDNLMNNICKYSLSGTRVYLTLEKKEGKAVFTFRNTSREALDLSEDELTERFVRGDSARNTEGNGLGLAIAKSMAELQGGTMTVGTDGDLFKAVLSFPVL